LSARSPHWHQPTATYLM